MKLLQCQTEKSCNRIVIENLAPQYEGYLGGSKWNYLHIKDARRRG